jgi:RNA polymerase sigma factor (sigma-70 family)
MSGNHGLAERFERDRSRLRAVAYRMLGSATEADDAVQEAWLRLARVDAGGIDNISAWLTTVVGRVCLDMLRSRASRREDPWDAGGLEPVAPVAPPSTGAADPEQEALLADSVGVAMLVVLETLTPVERLAFVLHDMFAVPFDEIAPIVGRSPAAARQLASRARRRIQADPSTPDGDTARQQRVVDAFLAASRGGDFDTLLTMLDPDVVMRVDAAAQRFGAPAEMRGAANVARFFLGRASGGRPALIDGAPGFAALRDGRAHLAVGMVIVGGRIRAIDAVADPDTLGEIEVTVLPA